MWKQCLREHRKAPFSDSKAPKSLVNQGKNRLRFLWDHQAAGLSPVAPTKISGFDRKIKAVRGILAAFYFIFKEQHYGKNNVF